MNRSRINSASCGAISWSGKITGGRQFVSYNHLFPSRPNTSLRSTVASSSSGSETVYTSTPSFSTLANTLRGCSCSCIQSVDEVRINTLTNWLTPTAFSSWALRRTVRSDCTLLRFRCKIGMRILWLFLSCFGGRKKSNSWCLRYCSDSCNSLCFMYLKK